MSKTILAADVGYGNTKAVWSKPGTRSPDSIGEICFRSIAPVSFNPEFFALSGVGAGALDRVLVPIDGLHHIVGPDATITGGVRTLDPDYVNRGEYRALLAGAIHYMMKSTGRIAQSLDVLAVGLPVSNFMGKRAALKGVVSKVHHVPVPASLRHLAGGKDLIDVVAKKVMVLPQPFGALRLALDASMAGDLFDEEDEVNLVIDPGYNTFDWFLSRGLDPELEHCGSFPGGVSQIIKEVSHAAGLRLGSGDVNFADAELALSTGVLNLGGRKLDFTPYRAVAQHAAQRVVDEFLASFNPERIGVSKIFLAGGGAMHYLEPIRRRLPEFDVTAEADSVMSNARGFWLLANDLLGE
jgi:plasmid segregation protein ParM